MISITTKSNSKKTKKKPTNNRGKNYHQRSDGTTYNGILLPTDAKERRAVRNKLSAKAFRKRKADTLNAAKQDVADCDNEIQKLKMQLSSMRSKISSLQSVMDAIRQEHGEDATQHILNQCNDQAGDVELAMNTSTVRLLTSDSESMSNSELSNQASDDDSIKIEAV